MGLGDRDTAILGLLIIFCGLGNLISGSVWWHTFGGVFEHLTLGQEQSLVDSDYWYVDTANGIWSGVGFIIVGIIGLATWNKASCPNAIMTAYTVCAAIMIFLGFGQGCVMVHFLATLGTYLSIACNNGPANQMFCMWRDSWLSILIFTGLASVFCLVVCIQVNRHQHATRRLRRTAIICGAPSNTTVVSTQVCSSFPAAPGYPPQHPSMPPAYTPPQSEIPSNQQVVNLPTLPAQAPQPSSQTGFNYQKF